MSVERILVLNLTRFGDLIQTSPTIEALRDRYPGASVTLLVDRNFAAVAHEIPGVTEVRTTDLDAIGHALMRGPEGVLEAFGLVRDWVRELKALRFDLALNYSSSRMSAILMGMLGVPDVRGWTATPDGQRLIRHRWSRLFATMCLHRRWAPWNLVDYYRLIAGDSPGVRRRLHFRVRDEARREVDEILADAGVRSGESLVAIQPGASRAIRQWPTERYAAVAETVAARGFRPIVIGGAGDRALGDAISQAAGSAAAVVNLAGSTGIPTLAALLSRARLLVTGDTGPMHLAAAVDTPIVGLFFGPAMPEDTGPYGAGHLMVHAAVACAPCQQETRCGAPFCREEISAELIAHLAEVQLGLKDTTMLPGLSASVRVLRTGFDVHGFFDLEPVAGACAGRDAEIRRAYRAGLLHEVEGLGSPGGLLRRQDREPFALLADAARETAGLARELHQVCGASSDTGAVQAIQQEMAEVEARMHEMGTTHPVVAPLVRLAEFERESLPLADAMSVASRWAAIHEALARQAGAVAFGHARAGSRPLQGEDYAGISE